MAAHPENRSRIPLTFLLVCMHRHQKSTGVCIDALNTIALLASSCAVADEISQAQKDVLYIHSLHDKSIEVQWRALMAFHALGAGSAESKAVWASNGMTEKMISALVVNGSRSAAMVEWSLKCIIDLDIKIDDSGMKLLKKLAKSPTLAGLVNLLKE